MSLELISESVRINSSAGEDMAQTVVENDVIVPDINPDVTKILVLDGDVVENNVEVAKDKVYVSGCIKYKILYISDDPEQSIKSINSNSEFSNVMEMAGIDENMKARVQCDIEHIDFEILNGRKINVKAILKVDAKVVDENSQDFLTDVKGLPDIQILKENKEVLNYLGENEAKCVVEEPLVLPVGKPSIKEILRTDVKVVGKDFKVTDNKVIAKGDLNVLTLYTGDDENGSIQFMEHEVPFTQFIEIPGINLNSDCNVDYKIDNYTFKATEDSDGELRILKGEVALRIWAEGYEKKQMEVVADVYSLSSRLNQENKTLNNTNIICKDKSQIILKDIVSIDGNNPDISEVFNVLSKPVLFQLKPGNGNITLEGIVNNSVLYVANNNEQPIFCYNYEMPFTQEINIKEVKPNMGCEVELDVEHCNYSMISANEVEIRVVVNVNTQVYDEAEIDVLSNVSVDESEIKNNINNPSITIYFSQPGDNLWAIAKKYNTTIEDIKKVNNIENDRFDTGDQIIIPRKVV